MFSDKFYHLQRTSSFPWRVSNFGPKSGLKVVMNTLPNTSVDRTGIDNSSPGIMAVVHAPYEWPSTSNFIGAGSLSALKIKPTAFSTSDEVRSLLPDERQCNYNVSFCESFNSNFISLSTARSF